MAAMKHIAVGQLLDEYSFKFTVELCSEYLCSICQSILKNPYQSPCGCRYCKKCIENFLNGEEKYCPSQLEDCKEQTLVFEKDLQMDYIINKKISQLKAICPEEKCDAIVELKQMEQHINSHLEKCPFSQIGCKNPSDLRSNIFDHLNNGNYIHGVLITGSLIDMKTQVDMVKESLLLSKINREKQSEKIIDLENRLNEVQEFQKVKFKSLNEKLLKYQLENKKFCKEFEKALNRLDSNDIVSEGNLSLIKSRLLDLTRQFFENITNLQKNLDDTVEGSDKESLLDERNVDEEISFPNSETETNIMSESESPIISNQVQLSVFAPFSWKITGFNQKLINAKEGRQTYLISQPFYSHLNGYKLCLTVHPNGTGGGKTTHLSLFCHIMKGDHDDDLPWPMKMKTRLGLVDQFYGNIYCDKVFHYSTETYKQNVFNKPSAAKNMGFGDPKLISLDDLLKNKRIYKSDSIFIRCFVNW